MYSHLRPWPRHWELGLGNSWRGSKYGGSGLHIAPCAHDLGPTTMAIAPQTVMLSELIVTMGLCSVLVLVSVLPECHEAFARMLPFHSPRSPLMEQGESGQVRSSLIRLRHDLPGCQPGLPGLLDPLALSLSGPDSLTRRSNCHHHPLRFSTNHHVIHHPSKDAILKMKMFRHILYSNDTSVSTGESRDACAGIPDSGKRGASRSRVFPSPLTSSPLTLTDGWVGK